jgi:hypothetical protein
LGKTAIAGDTLQWKHHRQTKLYNSRVRAVRLMVHDLGNPEEPVAEVDPDDLRMFWQETRSFLARNPGQSVGMTAVPVEAVCKPEVNAMALWYRSTMIWVLQRFAPERLAPWVKGEEVSQAVFRTMATIQMEWIGHAEREGLPFDVEEFFLRLKDGGMQNG